MKTIRLAALYLLLLGAGTAPEAFAQSSAPIPPNTAAAPTAQAQRPVRPDRSIEITEARPEAWVIGTPQKPIFSGSMPIYPEAYDYMPAKEP